MVMRRRGLGRGLEALLGMIRGETDEDDSAGVDCSNNKDAPTQSKTVSTQASLLLPIHSIEPDSKQPRQIFNPDSLQDLADSIRAHGVLQPVVVRPLANKRYMIIAGERRWRASKMAGLSDIPAVIKVVDEAFALVIAFIENSHRDSLTPLEEAQALNRLMKDFSLTQQAIAQAIGKSRTTVANLLRLLELEAETSQYLASNKLEVGHARVLLTLQGEQQCQVARRVVINGLSVRETDKLVRRLQMQNRTAATNTAAVNQGQDTPLDVRKLQGDLTSRLGTTVDIRHGSSGKGRLIITYNNLSELDSILSHIN